MKKLFLVAAAAIMAVSASAQGKQKFWVGGTLGFSQVDNYASSRQSTVSSFTVLPEFGYNFNNRRAVGIRLGMAQTNIDDTGSIQTFTVAPFARYTFLDWRALSLFADGGIDFSSADGMLSADGSSIMDGRVISCGLFVNPGFSVRLCKQVSLVGRTNMNLFTAGYSEAEMYSDDSDTDTWTLALNPEFSLKRFVDSITLGFVVTF